MGVGRSSKMPIKGVVCPCDEISGTLLCCGLLDVLGIDTEIRSGI